MGEFGCCVNTAGIEKVIGDGGGCDWVILKGLVRLFLCFICVINQIKWYLIICVIHFIPVIFYF